MATLIERWYRQKAEGLYRQVLHRYWDRYSWGEAPVPTIRIRVMTSHWGSLSPSGLLSLNPNLAQAPLECIEYVICHELCHLVHNHHGPSFVRLLDERMPDWKRRKHRLELSLVS